MKEHTGRRQLAKNESFIQKFCMSLSLTARTMHTENEMHFNVTAHRSYPYETNTCSEIAQLQQQSSGRPISSTQDMTDLAPTFSVQQGNVKSILQENIVSLFQNIW
jgi:hypothetical protein